MEHSLRSLACRTVHIKIHPMAKTFAERREVLRVLQRFGQVEMFRSLKYHPTMPVPNAFLSILATESAATDLIKASPIRYRLIPTASTSPAPFPNIDTKSLFEPEPNLASEQESPLSPEEEEQIFQLSISPSYFDHKTYLSSPLSNPLAGPYIPVSNKYSAISASLASSIPESLSSAGLRDWETDGLTRRRGGVRSDGRGAFDNANVPWRIVDKEREELKSAIPEIMKGLKALSDERDVAKKKEVT